MIKLKQAVLVEGKYDKIKLSSIIDATIIVSNGFGIFKNKEKIELLRRLAKKDGLLILTDSDGAGFAIRGYVKGCIQEGKVYQAYIPEILGKEKRKVQPSKEGTLGVEGMKEEVLLQALEKCGVLKEQRQDNGPQVTMADLYADGFCGREDSAHCRALLLQKLDLPGKLSTKELIRVINTMFSYQEYRKVVEELQK